MFWRLCKAVHTHLQPKAAEAYKDMQYDNARKFVLDILNDPKNHQKHAARYVLTKSICDPCIDMLLRLEGIQHPSFFG
jgi:hypothetical protein